MINYTDAFSLIQNEFENFQLTTETINLSKAINRTLAEDIKADVNMPPFDNSAVDGIAIKFDKDITSWKLVGEISAGNFVNVEIDKDQAIKIMTGAKVPNQCDTVIPLEDYTVSGNKVTLKKDARFFKGSNIRPMASDIAINEISVPSGKFLNARNIAAIAACGKSEVLVYKKIKFAILATGDELIPIDQVPTGDKIRVSNNIGLTAAVSEMNQAALDYGFISDNYENTKEIISKMIDSDADIILTTGGVSVGKYDFVKDIFNECGVEEIFWRANIKPGKPAYFGKVIRNGRTKLVFGLPGNPVSCMVNFDVYLKPNIIAKLGMPQQVNVKATLINDIKKKDGKRHFVRGRIEEKDGNYLVTSNHSQSSGNLVGFSMANCLIELKEDVRNPKKGESVICILM